jgi:hypothetical protein
MRDQNFAYTFMHEFLPFENALTSEDEMTASVDKWKPTNAKIHTHGQACWKGGGRWGVRHPSFWQIS